MHIKYMKFDCKTQNTKKRKDQTINYEWRMRTKSITSRKIQEKSPWIFIQCEMKPQKIYAKNVEKLQTKKKSMKTLKK